MKPICHLSALAAAAALLPAVALAQGSITALGTTNVRASGISPDGQAISGYGSNLAYYWTNTFPAFVSAGDGLGSEIKISNGASFMSADITDPANNLKTAARWDATSSLWTPIPTLGSSSGTSASTAYDMSGDGGRVVGLAWVSAGQAHAFSWTPAGGTVDIGLWLPGPGWSSRANAVSSNGQFAAGLITSPQRAIRWNLAAGTGTYLGSLNPSDPVFGSSTAFGISADGTYVVGTSNNNAFIWSAATGMQTVGVLGTPGFGNSGYGTAVSADGNTVVGWSGSSSLNSEALIWKRGWTAAEKLQDYLVNNGIPDAASQWQVLKYAADISDDGRFIVGWGVTISGQTEGFRVEMPVALPSTYCTAKVNSLGCSPAIGSIGYASVGSNQPFLITCGNVLNNKSGLLFYGFGQIAAPFQGGYLCVQPPSTRTPVQLSGGSTGLPSCTGQYSYDFNALIRSGVDTRLFQGVNTCAQFWMRDPASFPTVGLSDGLGFLINL
jgi:probable HAF family extracellular repeat protein